MSDTENLACPFCGDSGFDKVGLKGHLEEFCEVYPTLETPFQQACRRYVERMNKEQVTP